MTSLYGGYLVSLPNPSNPFEVKPDPSTETADVASEVATVEPATLAVAAPAVAPQMVTLTREDLQALLDNAINRAVAAVVANAPGVAAPAPPAKPEIFTINWLLKMLVAASSPGIFHSEHLVRSALATIDHHVPEPADEDDK